MHENINTCSITKNTKRVQYAIVHLDISYYGLEQYNDKIILAIDTC